MKALKINDLTERQWMMYLEMLKGMEEKFGENFLREEGDLSEYRDFGFFKKYSPEKFKEERLKFINDKLRGDFEEYLIVKDEQPEGWIGIKDFGDNCEFVFDMRGDEIGDEGMKKIFEICRDYISSVSKDEISYWSHDIRKQKAVEKAGMLASETFYKTSMTGADLNIDSWSKIVESNKHVKKFRLHFCNEVPEESYGEYAGLMNEIVVDKEFYNPEKPQLKKITVDDVKRKAEMVRQDPDPFYMLLLYDGKKIAAVCSLWIERGSKTVLNHNGGITAVGRNYRGMNLAKYLKAKMYLKASGEFDDIEYIMTDTYPWNKYMYRINEEMGFKPYKEEKMYTITKIFLDGIIK